MFWSTLLATFIGAVAGGCVASVVSYSLARRAAVIEATYKAVRQVLSDKMSEKRNKARQEISYFEPECIAKPPSREHPVMEMRHCLLATLNCYDLILSEVSGKILDESQIKSLLWEIMKDDYLCFKEVVIAYQKHYCKDTQEPFPHIEEHMAKWG